MPQPQQYYFATKTDGTRSKTTVDKRTKQYGEQISGTPNTRRRWGEESIRARCIMRQEKAHTTKTNGSVS